MFITVFVVCVLVGFVLRRKDIMVVLGLSHHPRSQTTLEDHLATFGEYQYFRYPVSRQGG